MSLMSLNDDFFVGRVVVSVSQEATTCDVVGNNVGHRSIDPFDRSADDVSDLIV
jgi:hypothetical protein